MHNKAEFYVKNCVMIAFTTMSATKSHDTHMDVLAHRRIGN
jgi:hypothetical protein